jgi:hypothetical protein
MALWSNSAIFAITPIARKFEKGTKGRSLRPDRNGRPRNRRRRSIGEEDDESRKLVDRNKPLRRLRGKKHIPDNGLFADTQRLSLIESLPSHEPRQYIAGADGIDVIPSSATSSATVLVYPAIPCLAET